MARRGTRPPGSGARRAWEDEDDWVGEPPEGRHGADRARPEFWRLQRPPEVLAAVLLLALIVVVLVVLLR